MRLSGRLERAGQIARSRKPMISKSARAEPSEIASYIASYAESQRLTATLPTFITSYMARKITATERAVSWRNEKLADGYKQKAFLLSPAAVKALAALAKSNGEPERDVVERLILFGKARSK